MKIDKKHIDVIRAKFAAMQSKDDLLGLLNEAKDMLYEKETSPILLKQLTYYVNPSHSKSKRRYSKFEVRKKNGGVRIIHAPVQGLKSILRSLNFVLQCMFEPHKAATGFVLNKSIVDNAKMHIGKNYVYNIDLKDFFHSFDRNRVKMGFLYEPFDLGGKREPLAFMLASLCTHPLKIAGETKIVLPQGSPTSPTLTNMLSRKMDRRLAGLAKRFGLVYSRYADDITFSADHNCFKGKEFLDELQRIITDQGFEINPTKTRLQKTGYRQEVTGLIVNEKPNVKGKYVKQIRMYLYYWEKYGHARAQQLFEGDYFVDKGHVKKGSPAIGNVLDGKLEYLKMVKGKDDATYLKLLGRFEKLIGVTNIAKEGKVDLDTVVDAILNKGLSYGIELFEKYKNS